jgi:ascorbate-specific PTS system EIIC-type component UlaA
MLRIVLGVIAGFIGWLIVWIGSEKVISAVWPAFGANQKAFEEVLKNSGGQFAPDTSFLVTQILMGSIVSLVSGVLAALVAGENAHAPFYLGIALFVLGVLKAYMSWQYVPIWYHIIFTALLLPLAILGGKLISSN